MQTTYTEQLAIYKSNKIKCDNSEYILSSTPSTHLIASDIFNLLIKLPRRYNLHTKYKLFLRDVHHYQVAHLHSIPITASKYVCMSPQISLTGITTSLESRNNNA